MTTAEFLESAWVLVKTPAALVGHYRTASKKNPQLELALMRWDADGDDGEDAHLALEGTKELIAPLATAELYGERVRWAAPTVNRFGSTRSAEFARERLPRAAGPELKASLLAVLAHFGKPEEFKLVHPLVRSGFSSTLHSLVLQRDPVAIDRLFAAARAFLDSWRNGERFSSSDWEAPFEMITVIAGLDHPEAASVLLDFIDTPAVIHAFGGLERLAEPRAREAARALFAETRGEVPRSLPYTLAAQGVLHTLGEPQGLEAARQVFACAFPKRYGWPKLEHVRALRTQALRALRTRGTKRDREHVATFVTDSNSKSRAEGLAAAKELGRTVELEYLDLPYLKWLLKHEGLGAVKKRLDAPNGVFRDNVAKLLATSKDAGAKQLALKWALEVVEGQTNYPIDEIHDAEPQIHAAVEILGRSKKTPAVARSKSAWVRQFVFEEELAPVEKPPSVGPLRAKVERIDAAPFVFGSKINGLALDSSGERLAVVMGDANGVIVDTKSGATLTHVQERYRWAFDAAFSPDAKTLAVAYHGGHLVLFDAKSGQRVHEFEGFHGVPAAVKRLAFSPDGSLIAAGGSDGSARLFDLRTRKQLWAFEGKSSFEAVAFSPDSKTCVFSQVSVRGGNVNELRVLDVRKKKATVVKMPSSMWALAFDAAGHLWVGGEGKDVLELDETFAPVRGGKLKQAQVVRLGWVGAGHLVAVSQSGEAIVWDPKRRAQAHTLDPKNKAAIWGLATTRTAIFCAGDGGVVRRFDASGANLGDTGGVVHTQQPRGFVPFPDGSFISGAWDGKLLRWPRGAEVAELLYDHQDRVNAIAGSTDGERIYCAGDGQVVIHDVAARTQQVVKVKTGHVEDIAVRDGKVAVATDAGQVHLFDESADGLELRWTCAKAASEALSVAITSRGTVLFGTDRGGLGELDAKGARVWTKREHGFDLIDKDPLGNPHRDVVGLDTHGERFASLSNDDTLRVFEVGTKRRTLRAFADGGLFNNCVFSPDGAWVAAAGGGGVNLFDARTGAWLCEVNHSAFKGSTGCTTIAFCGPRELLLGTENGNIYRVRFE